MENERAKISFTERGILSIPPMMLDMACISANSDLVVEAIPGVLLIGQSEPLRRANQPLLDLFAAMGIEPEDIEVVLKRESRI